ncbi:MAG: OmpH family outer membrane protein [Candidatus Margulisbacteria bacterium]|nr:OmpH family outer membrane protein [Candidatus Margulisiibacteriota bacterium]
MKKLLIIAVVLAFAAHLAYGASFSNIGFIDVQKVFKEYKETEKAQADLAKQEESFKKEFEESQKKLETAEKEGKKKEDLEKMRKELEEKLAPKRDNLLMLNQQLTQKLQSKILDAVKKATKKVGIEVVLDKQVVITGGMDLTELVLTELNK